MYFVLHLTLSTVVLEFMSNNSTKRNKSVSCQRCGEHWKSSASPRAKIVNEQFIHNMIRLKLYFCISASHCNNIDIYINKIGVKLKK